MAEDKVPGEPGNLGGKDLPRDLNIGTSAIPDVPKIGMEPSQPLVSVEGAKKNKPGTEGQFDYKYKTK